MLIRKNHEMRLKTKREKNKNATLFSFVCVVSAFHCKEYLFSFLLTLQPLAYSEGGKCKKVFSLFK